MTFLIGLSLLLRTHAGTSCYSYTTAQDCNSTILPCEWQPYCSTSSQSACYSYADNISCNRNPVCTYITASSNPHCSDVCSPLQPAVCTGNPNCILAGACAMGYCSEFEGSACPSSCSVQSWCGPSQPDTCLQHSQAVCAQHSSSCQWLNGQCQSPCWSRSSQSCVGMQGCNLTSTCSDSGSVGCPQASNDMDCMINSNSRCAFNDQTQQCALTCGNQPNQLACVEAGSCGWQSVCQQNFDCSAMTGDAVSCKANPACQLSSDGSTCGALCYYINDGPICQSISGCLWQTGCTDATAGGCPLLTRMEDCTDTSNGQYCDWSNYCMPKISRCYFIDDPTNCATTYPSECKWETNTGGQPAYCASVCQSLSSTDCANASKCYLETTCSTGSPPTTPPVDCSALTTQQDCYNAPSCYYRSACFLAGAVEGVELNCALIDDANTCWSNPNCIFGAGSCLPKCAFLGQSQCTAQGSGCEWRPACTSSANGNFFLGQDPTVCDIESSPVFNYLESPCNEPDCSEHWGDATLSTQCNALAKTYCCGTNSTTCALDNQCYEHYFGDGPLCAWTCDFTSAITEACQAVGACTATSATYSKTETFATAATAFENFDAHLTAIGLPPPIYHNGSLCANGTEHDSTVGVFWKDNLDGDLQTTIDFDFWTTDFAVAFGVVFTTNPVLQNTSSLDAVGECLYVASCSWNQEIGSGCNLNLGNTFAQFKYSVPTATGPWVNLQPGRKYHATVVKSTDYAFSLTVSGTSMQSVSMGPLAVGRKFTRFGVLLPSFNPTVTACIDNLAVHSSTCPGGHFSTAAPVGAVPTSSPVSRAPTSYPTPPPVPTTGYPTHSPVTGVPTRTTTSSPSSAPITSAPTHAIVRTSTPSRAPTTHAPIGIVPVGAKSGSSTLTSFLSFAIVPIILLLC